MEAPNISEISAEIGIPEEELRKLLDREFDSDKTTLPMPMSLKHVGYAKQLIHAIKKDLKDSFVGRRDFIKNMNTAFRLIMCNMVGSTFSRNCLSLPSTERLYNKGSYFNKLFLTRAATEAVLMALISKGYIKKNIGNKRDKKVNNYFPSNKLQLLVLPLLYEVKEEYSPATELIIFKEVKAKGKEKKNNNKPTYKATSSPGVQTGVGTMRRRSVELLTTYGTDLEALTRINKALKCCTYALKSPVKRIYSEEHPMMGGRLYTRLQGLPDKRARIRINTLFNGEPVAEVDLSANHPRMLMALKNRELSATFYDDVAKATKTTREQVKFFTVKAIGAKNKRISLKPKDSKDKEWVDRDFILKPKQREQIETHLQKHYPEITEGFYKNMGTHLQAFEGDILLRAMLDLLDHDIPSLPMHDAIYVQQRYKKYAQVALENAWMHELEVTFRPVTTIDLPKSSH